MNTMLRRKKRVPPHQPRKRKLSRRANQAWNGQVNDGDRYWASLDPRQLSFAFHPTPVTFSSDSQAYEQVA